MRRTLWPLGLLLAATVAGQEGDPFTPCEQALREEPESVESAKCFYSVARQENRWEEAHRRLDGHRQAHPELPWLSFFLASLVMDQGGREAPALFEVAARAFARQGDTTGELYSRINRARLLQRAGRLEEALEEAQRAAAAAAVSSDPTLRQEVRLLTLRLRYMLGGERVALGRDLQALRQALDAESSYTLRRDVAKYMAVTAYELGEYEQALEHYEAAAALARKMDDRPTLALVELSALFVALAQRAHGGWRDEARERATRALEAALDAGVPMVEASARLTLGRLTKGPAGVALLEGALAVARQLEDAELERDALGYLALRRVDESPSDALALADASLAAARGATDPLAPAYGWFEQLEVRWRAEGREAALAQAAEMLDLVEETSRVEGNDTGRARLFSVWAETYYWLAGRLFEAYRESGERELLEQAFAVQERMRARLLEPPRAAKGESESLVSLADLEGLLSPREAVLSIQLGQRRNVWGYFAGGAWLTVTTRLGTKLFPLPDLSAVEPQVAMFLGLVERRDGAEEAAGHVLYEALLEELLAALPPTVDRLILVPDGPLHLLPFAALPNGRGGVLGEDFQLSRSPSATVWHRLRRRAEPDPNADVVAVVDPLLGADAATISGLRTWLPERGDDLGPLRFAHREGRTLRRVFGTHTRLLAGPEAAEPAVKTALERTRLAHFATHALVDTRSPERSAVVLATTDDHDGLLTSPEIADLNLAGPLVVLSTCESAAGPLLRGEGPMSLARAFFRAGARTVVASLWRLRDHEAAALFDRFYHHLSYGLPVAESLRRAQQDAIEAGTPARAWAGVAVLGDGDWAPVPTEQARGGTPSRSPMSVTTLAVALFVLALGLLLLLRRHKESRSRP